MSNPFDPRYGERSALRRQEVDRDSGTVHIRRTLLRSKGEPVFCSTIGTPLDERAARRSLHAIPDEANLPALPR